MSIFAIATLYRDEGFEEGLIGFRLIDSETGEVKNASTDNVMAVLARGGMKIENLGLQGRTVCGTNGSIDRLPRLVDGYLVTNSVMTILCQIENRGYMISDFKGQIAHVTNRLAIDYAERYGISNGKVVVREDGRRYISPINGRYEVMELPNGWILEGEPDEQVRQTKQSVNNIPNAAGTPNYNIKPAHMPADYYGQTIHVDDPSIIIQDSSVTLDAKINLDAKDSEMRYPKQKL